MAGFLVSTDACFSSNSCTWMKWLFVCCYFYWLGPDPSAVIRMVIRLVHVEMPVLATDSSSSLCFFQACYPWSIVFHFRTPHTELKLPLMTYRMNCYSRFFRLEFVFLRWLHFCISSPHIRLRPSCHCAEVGTRASRKTTDTSCCLSCVEAMASSLQCCVHHSRSFWPQGSGLRLLCTSSINLYRL